MSNTKTREIKTKFSIEGERNLKAALKENAAQAKELKSEMALLDAKFADATDSEEYLAEKSELLARQTANAQEKVDLYNGALESARQRQQQLAQQVEQSRQALQEQEAALEAARVQYGDGSEQVAKLTDELEYNRKAVENQEAQLSKANKAVLDYETSTNYAKVAQTKLENSTNRLTHSEKENANQVSKMADEMDDAADMTGLLDNTAKSLASKLGVDLPDGVSVATGSISSMSAGVAAATAVVTALINAVVEAGKKLVEISRESGEWATELEKMSDKTGISKERLQEYEFAFSQVGVTLDKFVDSTKDLSNALASSMDATSEQYNAFRELGISVKNADGSMKSIQQTFEPVIIRLSRITDETNRASIGTKIFGENYFELLPIIKNVGEVLAAANSEQAKTASLADENTDALSQVNSEFVKLRTQLDYIKRAMASGSTDEINNALARTSKIVQELGNYLIEIGAVSSIGEMVELLSQVVDLMTSLVSIPGVSEYFDGLNIWLSKINDWLDSINRLLDSIPDKITKVPDLIWNLGLNMGQNLRKSVLGYAAGSPFVGGGSYTVGEYGPERVILPRGASVMNARDTASAAAGTTNITLNVSVPNLETLNKIVQFYENYQITKRMG